MSWPRVEPASWDPALLLAWSRGTRSLTLPAGSVPLWAAELCHGCTQGHLWESPEHGHLSPLCSQCSEDFRRCHSPKRVFLPAPICFCLCSSTFSFLFSWISSLGCWQLAKCCSSFSLSQCSVFFYKDGKMEQWLQMLHVGCERHSSWNGFYTNPYLQHGKGDRRALMGVFQALWVLGELLLPPGSSANAGTCRDGPSVEA